MFLDATGADLAAHKRALRTTVRAARAALSPQQRQAASAALSERLLALPELQQVDTALLYAAMVDEADVAAAVRGLQANGTRTLLPRMHHNRLQLVTVTDLHALPLGYRGIREPAGVAIDPSVVDVAIVPGVAFDPHGGRLGQGGGHYDRLLPTLPAHARRIGAGFACQMVPEVPREAHDMDLDTVVTERAVYRAPTT